MSAKKLANPFDDLDAIDEAYGKEKAAMQVTAARSPSVKIRLGTKIKVNSVEVGEITMRRPTANDLLEMQGKVFHDSEGARLDESGQDAEREKFLVARLAGAAPEEVGQCDMADWGMCQAALQGFLRGRLVRRG